MTYHIPYQNFEGTVLSFFFPATYRLGTGKRMQGRDENSRRDGKEGTPRHLVH